LPSAGLEHLKDEKNAPRELVRQREAMIASFLKGTAPRFMEDHARLLDDFFRESFERSMTGPMMDMIKNPYAIIALGGYGRQEQCIHSDIDLLFLFKKKVPAAAEELIREVVYPLWDIGFDVGYATRSLKECIQIAAKDFEVLTSLLDARFLCGVSLLYTELLETLRKRVLFRQAKKLTRWLVENNEVRHRRHGDSSYLLEPNLKEGQGGLRDYHTMLWVGKIDYGFTQPRDLEYQGHLSHSEYRRLRAALSFIWDVRSRLHHMAGRKCDQLHLEFQLKLARAMRFEAADGQKPVERFLGKLHGAMDLVKDQYLMFLRETGAPKRSRAGRRPTKTTEIAGLEVRRESLDFVSPERILQTPSLLIQIFEESARLKIPVSHEARLLVAEFSHLVDDAFRTDPAVVKSFERILLVPAPVFSVLNAMLAIGFLPRLIPGFGDLVNRIQYNEYHIYPVDRHSIRTVQTLKSFGTEDDHSGEPLCGKLYKALRNRKPLLWAALLHDIGKGAPGGRHAESGARIAAKRMAEFGYSPEEASLISDLVRDHLLLIKVATRRDLNDEETAISCARQIRDVERLKMLFLLTVADSVATGPKAWNDWTAVLVRELFLKVLSILEHGELASQEAVAVVERKRHELVESVPPKQGRREMEALFSAMSPRYLIYMPTEFIREHIELYRRLGDRQFVWNVKKANGTGTRTVIVCAKDRPGLFSKIAGVFTLNGVDILDAQIFTWRNNVALDIFEVKPPPDQIFEDERWLKAEANLHAALAGDLDVSDRVGERIRSYRPKKPRIADRPHRVQVDNETSSFFSIVEVITYNFPGLLFSITDALYRCELDIWVAKIATRIDQVVDVFYVRDFHGQKVAEPEKVAAIEAAVLQVLPEPGSEH
jgi:[protein-PII] uridylyltransferase